MAHQRLYKKPVKNPMPNLLNPVHIFTTYYTTIICSYYSSTYFCRFFSKCAWQQCHITNFSFFWTLSIASLLKLTNHTVWKNGYVSVFSCQKEGRQSTHSAGSCKPSYSQSVDKSTESNKQVHPTWRWRMIQSLKPWGLIILIKWRWLSPKQ